MVETSQHPAGAGCQVKLKMWNFYAWLIICGFASDVLCTGISSGKQTEAQTISTMSSIEGTPDAITYTEEVLDRNRDQSSNDNDRHIFLRAVPRVKAKAKPKPSSDKPKSDSELDYVIKIPLSTLRQLQLYRLIMLQEFGENPKFKKRQSVIPVLRYGRSANANKYDVEGSDNTFHYPNSEEDNFLEEYMNELLKEAADSNVSESPSRRSMLLLSSPKSEDTTKEKPSQTFVLPYPRPGRSNEHVKDDEAKKYQLTLLHPTSDHSKIQDKLSEIITLNGNEKKYILPTARYSRSSLDTSFGNEKDIKIVDDWISNVKYNPRFLKLNTEKASGNTEEENGENSFFVIPYPRPGKRSTFKLKNGNQEAKDYEKEITDYLLPYPRPGKKSEGEKSSISSKYEVIKNNDPLNLIAPYARPEKIGENSLDISYAHDLPEDSFSNENIDVENIMEHINNARITPEEFKGMLVENKFMLPYLRKGKRFDNLVPYPRPGRSASHDNVALQLLSDDTYPYFSEPQLNQYGLRNSKDILRSKRSTSVVPYPRLGRSNSVVPYPRLGRSNVVVPYPRLGRSNSVLPYPRTGRSDSVLPYPRLGRSSAIPKSEKSNSLYDAAVSYAKLGQSNSIVLFPLSGRSKRSSSVVPFPRLGRSDSVVPYPRLGRSDSVVPYPRPGRSDSVVPYPRPGRSDSVVPYPRPGRAESVVPYPRPGRAESVVPYPRPGRADSVVPYPRPGRAESVVPYPRPGRAESIVPYPRPGRSNSVVPYPRLGRSAIGKTGLSNKYTKEEKWLLPNLRPGRSSLNQDDKQTEKSDDTHNSEYTDVNSNALSEWSSIIRYSRANDGQGYILPHPRVGRSLSYARQKKEFYDTDTIIPYPRLGRSQKETIPDTTSSDTPNSVHKLNKHMLSNVQDSVYLLPYPRPGRYVK